MNPLVVLRHGETDWSRAGRHTGRTDVELTDVGAEQARALAPLLAPWVFVQVFTSPALRAKATARLAGVDGPAVVDDDLQEWDYGQDEGRTTAEIRVDRPGWTVWEAGPLGGEKIEDVQARVDRFLERVAPLLKRGPVAVVGHGHCLRALAARWLGLDAREGKLFVLDPATISELGFEREVRVIRSWNRA